MKKQYKGLLIALAAIIFAIAALLILFLLPDFKAEQTTNTIYIELGSRVTKDPSDYISCSDWCKPFSIIDTKNVDTKKAGTYPITLYHGFQKLFFQAIVEDTTPPAFKTDLTALTIKKGKSINLESLGIKVSDKNTINSFFIDKIFSEQIHMEDNSEESTLLESSFREGISVEDEKYTFEYGGIYHVTISATDAANNSADYTIRVTVEEPPVINVPEAYYVATNETVDFTEYVTTWDFLDTKYSIQDIVVDTSQVFLTKQGEYPITFTGTDNYGLTTTVSSVVYVASADYLQNLINTHAVSVENDIIIGALNRYDNGYFTNQSTEFIQQAVLPSLVHIYNPKKELSGSGYILDISDEFVTIATNHHVIDKCILVTAPNDMVLWLHPIHGMTLHLYAFQSPIPVRKLPLHRSMYTQRCGLFISTKDTGINWKITPILPYVIIASTKPDKAGMHPPVLW